MPWHLRYSLRLIFHVIEYERAIKKRVYGNYPIMNRFHDEAKKKKASFQLILELVNYTRVAFPRNNSSQFIFQDCHIKTHSASGEPVPDASADYVLLSSSENATHTILRFRRKLNTCDEKFDVPITVRRRKIC